MKEETKKKLCKISKIVGFAITFGFAVFGVLCAAMLIGNGSKKDDIKTLDSSLVQNEVRSERNIKPRKAPDFSNAHNYFDDAEIYEDIFVNSDTYVEKYASSIYTRTWALGLEKGVYYFETSAEGYSTFFGYTAPFSNLDSWLSLCRLMNVNEREKTPDSLGMFKPINDNDRATSGYFYFEGGSISFSHYRFSGLKLFLVDTLELPATSSISFPDSFSPLGLFGDSVTNNGGYVYLPNATGNELDIEITGLIFKYGGVVYDGIHIECVRALSMGYINDDGQLVKQGGANDYMWALSWIKFYQRYKGQSPQDGIVVVMAELKSVTDNANDMPVAFTGRTQWVNRSDRTIQIIDDLGTITGRYDGRYSDMTDKKLLEWVSSSFSVGNSLGVMGNNSVFDIFTNAFDSVLPILSIAILPNITLGMLLFIPLIGAIIVVIIRVVKK